MNFKDCISNNGWISPNKIIKNSKKPKRKEAKTLTLNITLINKIAEIAPENKRSALIDKILSEHFGIKYEDAYPEAYAKSYGEERLWDYEGIYKRLDIQYPGRFSTKSKRNKNFSYKAFMQKIK